MSSNALHAGHIFCLAVTGLQVDHIKSKSDCSDTRVPRKGLLELERMEY